MPKTYDREKTASSTNVAGLFIFKKLKLDPCSSPYTSINSKWIKYLNIRPDSEVTTRRSRKHSGTNRYRQRLHQYNPSSPATKRKNGQMGLHKIKSFCTTNEMVSKLKRPSTE
jgi:hypothetical protein